MSNATEILIVHISGGLTSNTLLKEISAHYVNLMFISGNTRKQRILFHLLNYYVLATSRSL